MSSPVSDIQLTASAYQRFKPDTTSSPAPLAPPNAPASPAPPYQVSLSSESRNLSISAAEGNSPGAGSAATSAGTVAPGECQTCNNRKYVDVSDDPTVSFQTPTSVSPAGAESLVRAHEQEHVANEQARAEEQGDRVVSQSVTIGYSICPECGRSYVAGGTTTTVTKSGGDRPFSGLEPRGPSTVDTLA